MAGIEITQYVAALSGYLVAAGADATDLATLASAGQDLADLADSATGSISNAQWTVKQRNWETALEAFNDTLAEALLGPLAEIPALADLVSDVGRLASEGVHGGLTLGPVHLEVASATLVLQPPAFSDNANPATVTIGPFQVGEIAASLSPVGGGGGLPGGGSIVRLPLNGGYGGTLQLPLGPVQISAAAVLSMIDGNPSFLAILGASFLPPLQLSFGFSLDRVGGIIGVNRRADTDALRGAVRTGTAGDVLFAVRPPPSPLVLVVAADRLFPAHIGSHLVGPSLKLSWLSFGTAGSLIGLSLAVIVEIPTGKVVILGVAQASIPGLPMVMNLRLDVLGIIDPVEQIVSVDASLVDSHLLGIFEVYGDAALRLSWGTTAYVVASVGGFFPGFNPEPAHIPALRRVGMALDNPVPIIEVRAEGYFAITSNSLQFGGRLEVGISLGIEAHGFVQVDAIVQFRPFHFVARIAAGFDVSAGGFSFASVTLEGEISGPGPLVIRGSLSIDVFLFSISWDETFTLGSGPADALPTPDRLLDVMFVELGKPESVQSASISDPLVLLKPKASVSGRAAVPPTGTLRIAQRRAPLGILIERLDGRPLDGAQGVAITSAGIDVTERFSPGSYVTLTDSEAVSRPPFDQLVAGRVISIADPALSTFPHVDDTRVVRQILIVDGVVTDQGKAQHLDLTAMVSMVSASLKPPALSDTTPLVTATLETWAATGTTAVFTSATAAHQYARYNDAVAVASADAADPLSLAGVL